MAAEAEATREARAKVIAAEGEQRASRALKEAAEVISQSPSALQVLLLFYSILFYTFSYCNYNRNDDIVINNSCLDHSYDIFKPSTRSQRKRIQLSSFRFH